MNCGFIVLEIAQAPPRPQPFFSEIVERQASDVERKRGMLCRAVPCAPAPLSIRLGLRSRLARRESSCRIAAVGVAAFGAPEAATFNKRPDAADVGNEIDEYHDPGLVAVMPTLDLQGQRTPNEKHHRR